MKPFDCSTKFESNTEYRLKSDRLSVTLSDTVRLEEKIYRAIYMSKKTWLDTAIYLMFTSVGYVEGRTAPIMVDGITDAAHYINPIPSGLVLTGIVVSVSVTALMLALTVRLYRRYHTLDIDRITLLMKGEDD